MAHFLRHSRKKPGFPLQVLGFAMQILWAFRYNPIAQTGFKAASVDAHF
ncbi:MAG: hypothetical protein LBK44_04275 [Spirochaetales bacterium]|jgi:hypothetical protein|nr:hypothetical protein [Spirochaetales bacterium]